jgi:hypothetical protein
MLLFVLFYILAAVKYPGGSHSMPQKVGFSFWHNYLCDLLDTNAINGQLNTARHYARLALALLCASLMGLWLLLPKLFRRKSPNRYFMSVTGVLALGTTVFLGAQAHDTIVRIAGIFGLMALLSSFVELYKSGFIKLLVLGVVCLLVFLLNYYIYETGVFIRGLPVIQKVTFLLFLVWFVLLDILLFRKAKD